MARGNSSKTGRGEEIIEAEFEFVRYREKDEVAIYPKRK